MDIHIIDKNGAIIDTISNTINPELSFFLRKKTLPEAYSWKQLQDRLSAANIVYVVDNNYAECASVSILSLVRNASICLDIYILYSHLSDGSQALMRNIVGNDCKTFSLTFIKAPDNIINITSSFFIREGGHVSATAYLRLFFDRIFPLMDKIVYIDCDTLILTDIAQLWNTDINDKYLYAVKDFDNREDSIKRLDLSDSFYVNSGVLLINNREWINSSISSLFIKWHNKNRHRMFFHDQDILNGALNGKIGEIGGKWNTSHIHIQNYPDTVITIPKSILHFIGAIKPWMKEYSSHRKLNPLMSHAIRKLYLYYRHNGL